MSVGVMARERPALLVGVAVAFAAVFQSTAVFAARKAPPIRTDARNQVPACVTPDRLMAFLRTRNRRVTPRFRRIADFYRQHGETWRVRWDYAFFQMAIETNFLTYRQPNGKWGDVNPKQNNFAGLGTTGGGVPGDSYPDVSTGVLAQIQHLVVYSGERIPRPVGPRTRLKQDVILALSEPVARKRRVTFQDLSGRWAVDKRYGRSITYIASLFMKRFCKGAPRTEVAKAAVAAPRMRGSARPRAAARRDGPCRVSIASFGGSQTVLIDATDAKGRMLTALDVEPRDRAQMTDGFIAQYARGGRAIGVFDNRRAALSEAFRLCPAAAAPGR
ncbi:MAG: N-acetylmuramoyl-L-alanine amidase [Pseudomonadota bacterium]